MGNDVFKLGGLPLRKLQWSRQTKRAATLSVLLAASLLSGCQTTGTSTTVTGSKTICKPWKALTYSAEQDTLETIWNVRTHNQTGRNLRCWK